MHWVSWPGVCTCVVGGVLYLFSCVQNKQASQLEAAVPLEKLSGAPPAAQSLRVPVRSLSLCCFVSGALCCAHCRAHVCDCARGCGASSAVPVRCSPHLLPTGLCRPEEPREAGAVPGVGHRAHVDRQPAQVRADRPRRRHQRGAPSLSPARAGHLPATAACRELSRDVCVTREKAAARAARHWRGGARAPLALGLAGATCGRSARRRRPGRRREAPAARPARRRRRRRVCSRRRAAAGRARLRRGWASAGRPAAYALRRRLAPKRLTGAVLGYRVRTLTRAR